MNPTLSLPFPLTRGVLRVYDTSGMDRSDPPQSAAQAALAAGDITVLLARAKEGDDSARCQLLTVVYGELRKQAARQLRGERANHTLQTTELVHEAYLRLVGSNGGFNNRSHFFGAAAQAMRWILVDYAKAHRAKKRGGGNARVELDDQLGAIGVRHDEILGIDEALNRLKAWDRRQCQIVEMRFFGGMEEQEIAEVLNLSPRTVRREWRVARAWLKEQLGQ